MQKTTKLLIITPRLTPRSKLLTTLLPVFLTTLLLAISSQAEEGYPHRTKYPHIPIISVEELKACGDSCLIIDVRSRLEYNVIHINDSKNYNMSKARFKQQIQQSRTSRPEVKIVFYCNGHSCAKSYKATQIAIDEGLKNVAAFDSGIFDWALAQPDRTTLLGITPADTTKIIPKEEFKSRLVSYEHLVGVAKDPDTVIIDIREDFQREQIPNIPNLKHISLNILQAKLMSAAFKDKNIIFIDAVGKQVKWLQYYLNKFGYKNYRFLAKGVNGIPQDLL